MFSRQIETHMRTIRIKIFPASALLSVTLLLNACASWLPEAHHIEIQQGNIIEQAERDGLKTGMTKNEVQDLLGKAILRDPYHPNRWDYIYTIKSDSTENRVSRLTVHFENDQLITIDDTDFNPEK